MSTLICYDGSESSKHAVATAAAAGNGETTLLHVWSPPAEQLADSFSNP